MAHGGPYSIRPYCQWKVVEANVSKQNIFTEMGKVCRGIRANWNDEMMAEALRLLKEGKSQRFVEKHCGIPRKTLRNHMKTGSAE